MHAGMNRRRGRDSSSIHTKGGRIVFGAVLMARVRSLLGLCNDGARD